MRVRIDPDACVGHGRCYALAPEMFDADDQGHGLIRFGSDGGASETAPDGSGGDAAPYEIPVHLEGASRTGAANCPENAILIDG